MTAVIRKAGRPKLDRGVQVPQSRAVRAQRVPLGAPRLKLTVNENNPNFVKRWVNDKDGRLEDALEGGYRFIERNVVVGTSDVEPSNTDPGARVSRKVGVDENGQGLRSYLMEIDCETYEKDQAAKEEAIKRKETQIVNGNPDGQAGDGRFIPTDRGGIRLRT